MRRLFWAFSFLVVIGAKSFAQIGCPAVTAGPDTSICGPGPHCMDLTAVPISGFQTSSYNVQQIPYSPYPFNPAGGNPVSVNVDDTYSGVINLPFNFCFFGQSYNQCLVGSNGVITFDLTNAGGYCPWPISAAIPDPNAPINAIFCPWQDIDPSIAGDVYWHLYGTAPCRVLVVTFDNIAHFSCGTSQSNTYQAALYETTNIIEMYIQEKTVCSTWNGGAAIQGIQDASGTNAYVVPGRNFPSQWTATNDAWAFVPNGPVNYSLNWYEAGNPTSLGSTSTINVCPTVATDYVAEVVYNNCGAGTVTVTDTVHVVIGGAPFSLNPNITHVSCFNGTDGSVTATPAGGQGPFVYAWSNGGNTQTISNIPAGNYTVTVTDACGFDQINTFTVNQPTAVAVNATFTMPTCQGATDGTATATGSGGTGSISYAWSSGQTGATASNLGAGLYSVTATDANGCTAIATVSIPQPPPLTINAFSVNQTCPGANDGQVSAVPGGGTPPYIYTWNTGATTSVLTGLGPGTYSVTVTDANGCFGSASATVGSNPSPVADAGADVSFCAGEGGALLDGQASGTTAPYYYTWTCNQPICGLDSVFDNDPLANPTDTTWYYLQVTDANGCQSSVDSVLVYVLPKPTVDAGADVQICHDPGPGSLLNPTVTGSNGPFGFQWIPSAGLNDPTLMNPFARPDSTTIYALVVTDLSTGCSSEFNTTDTMSTVTVFVAPLPVANAGADRAICLGDSVRLQGIGYGAGPQYDFEWSPGNSLSDPNVATPWAFPTLTTEYILTVWSNGCPSYGDTLTVFVQTNPTVDAGPNRDICYGEVTQLDGQAGGTVVPTTYSYFWTPGSTLSDSLAEDPFANPTATTWYYLYAVTAEGCTSAMDSVLVTIRNTPIAEAGTNVVWCPNTPMIDLQGTYSFHNGQNPNDPQNILVAWEPSQYIVGNPNTSTVTINPPNSMYFFYTVTYDSCTHTDSVLVTVLNDLGLSLASDTSVTCQGDSVQLSASGGMGGAHFLWLPSTGLSDNGIANPLAAPDSTTTYTVIAFEAGCSDTAQITLDVLPTPASGYLSSLNEGCVDFTVNFLQTSNEGILYVWNFGDGSPVANGSNPSHTYTQPGVYNVTMTTLGAGGCSSFVTGMQVTVHDTATAAFRSEPNYPVEMLLPNTEVKFFDQSHNAVTWAWNFGDGEGSDSPNPSHVFPKAGIYFVTLRVTNDQGCETEIVHGPYMIKTPELGFPNVLTPNADGINDVFLVTYTGSQPFKLVIYDRWGGPVFMTQNKIEAWDGTSAKGGNAPEGVYYFVIEIGNKSYNGQVTLVR